MAGRGGILWARGAEACCELGVRGRFVSQGRWALCEQEVGVRFVSKGRSHVLGARGAGTLREHEARACFGRKKREVL